MKKNVLKLIVAFLLVSIGLNSSGQNSSRDASKVLSEVELFKQFGFDWVGGFCEDLALASLNNEMLVINRLGKKQFDFPYDYSNVLFIDGYARVLKDGLKGIIDAKGKEVVAPLFEQISIPCQGISIVKKGGENGFYDLSTGAFDSYASATIRQRDENLYELKEDGVTSIIDANGRVLVPAEYDFLNYQSEGLSVAKQGNKFGLIDSANKVLIPFEYTELRSFMCGEKIFVKGQKDRSWGLLNTANEVVLPFEYSTIESDKNGIIFTKQNEKYKVLDVDLKNLVPGEFDALVRLKSNRYSLRKGDSQFILNGKDGTLSETERAFMGGFVGGHIIYKEGEKLGVLDTALMVVIPASYENIRLVGKDYLEVQDEGQYSLLAMDNKKIFQKSYEGFGAKFINGIIAAKRSGKWGLVNMREEALTEFKYDRITKIRSANLFRVFVDGKQGLIDILGKEILPTSCEKIDDQFGYVLYKQDLKYGLLRKNGKEILPGSTDYISDLGMRNGGSFPNHFRIKKDGLYGVFNALSNEPVDYAFSKIDDVRGETIVAVKDSLYGLIDPDGNVIAPFEYSYLEDNGFSPFVLGSKEKTGLLRRDGTTAIPFEYDIIWNYQEPLIAVAIDERWGFVDRENNLVLAPKYKKVNKFNQGYCIVNDGGPSGLIDEKGNLVLPMEYDRINIVGPGLFVIKKDEKFGLMNGEGKALGECRFDLIAGISHGNMVVGIDRKKGVINSEGQEVLPIVFDNVKRQSKTLKTQEFNRTSISSGPSKNFELKFGEYEFVVNNDGECIENCPSRKVLKTIFAAE